MAPARTAAPTMRGGGIVGREEALLAVAALDRTPRRPTTGRAASEPSAGWPRGPRRADRPANRLVLRDSACWQITPEGRAFLDWLERGCCIRECILGRALAECPAPRSSERRRRGSATYPVSRQLVCRLLMRLPPQFTGGSTHCAAPIVARRACRRGGSWNKEALAMPRLEWRPMIHEAGRL